MGDRPLNRALGLWAAAFTGLQVGAAIVMSRAALAEIGPLWLAAFRYGVGVLVLLPVLAALRPRGVAAADRLPLAILGIAQFGAVIAFLNWGLIRIGAAEASVLFATFPVMTVLIAAALGREPLSTARLACAALTFAGVALTFGALPSGGGLGALAVLAAAFTGATCSVLTRPYLSRSPTLSVGTLAMFAATLALAAAALPAEGIPPIPGPLALTLTLAIGLSSGAGYVLWLTALKHAEAGEATVLLGLAPIAAVLLGWLFLNETPPGALWAGMAVALAGVTLTLRPPGPKRLASRGAGR